MFSFKKKATKAPKNLWVCDILLYRKIKTNIQITISFTPLYICFSHFILGKTWPKTVCWPYLNASLLEEQATVIENFSTPSEWYGGDKHAKSLVSCADVNLTHS